jgi:sorting nexin-4
MAVMDQDTFSNVSWSSEHGPDMSSPRSIDSASGAEVSTPGHRPFEPTLGSPSAGPVGDEGGLVHEQERLECTVGLPLKENDGSKDAFVSYLVTTNVLMTCSLFRSILC